MPSGLCPLGGMTVRCLQRVHPFVCSGGTTNPRGGAVNCTQVNKKNLEKLFRNLHAPSAPVGVSQGLGCLDCKVAIGQGLTSPHLDAMTGCDWMCASQKGQKGMGLTPILFFFCSADRLPRWEEVL